MTVPAPRPSERAIAEDLGEIARLIMWKHLGKHWQAPWYSPLVKDIEAALADARARIERARKIVELYFAPWGAAKAAEWEYLTGDKPFTPEVALACVRAALAEPGKPEETRG